MDAGDRWLLDHFIITRAKTIELARRVPDELWQRTAPGEELAVGKLFRHMADAVNWYLSHVLHGPAEDSRQASSRDEVIAALQRSRDRFVDFFEADDGRRMGQIFEEHQPDGTVDRFAGRDRVSYLADHEVHHRGKLVLALRQWGFTDFPPLPFWSPRDYNYLQRRD
jgi:uncharacterized damage-inducible protein DinB